MKQLYAYTNFTMFVVCSNTKALPQVAEVFRFMQRLKGNSFAIFAMTVYGATPTRHIVRMVWFCIIYMGGCGGLRINKSVAFVL